MPIARMGSVLLKFNYMARIKKGILGGVSGRLGNVIGGSWKGVDYLRSLPSGGRKDATAAQMQVRQSFRMAVTFLKPFTEVVRIGFAPQTAQKTAFNAAVSLFIKNAITGTYPDLEVDYSQVRLSQGTLPIPETFTLASSSAGQIGLTWTPLGGQPSDKLVVAAWCAETGEGFYHLTAAERQDGTAQLGIPTYLSGKLFHVYAFFVSAYPLGSGKTGSISNSVYAGSVTLG